MRTGHIGLNSDLHWRRCPGIDHPGCPSCVYPSRNAKHLVMFCPVWVEGRGEVLRKAKRPTFHDMMQDPEDLKRTPKWIISKGWIEQTIERERFYFPDLASTWVLPAGSMEDLPVLARV